MKKRGEGVGGARIQRGPKKKQEENFYKWHYNDEKGTNLLLLGRGKRKGRSF